MRQKTDTGMAFLDLMLCTIGCTLMIFAAQIPQTRGGGRGWDDRPLVVHAAAFGEPTAYRDGRLRFRWELTPVGKTGSAVIAIPAEETQPSEEMTFFVPEAEFGDFQLSVTIAAEPTDVGRAVRDLERAKLVGGASSSDAVRSHLRLYGQYRTLLKQEVTGTDVALFQKAKNAADEVPVWQDNGSGSIKVWRADLEWYLRYRRLAMLATLLDRSGGNSGETTAAIQKLLAEVDAAADAAVPSDSNPRYQWAIQEKQVAARIRVILRIDDEIRTSHKAGQVWWELNTLLDTVGPVTPAAWSNNPAYWAYCAEWVRGRARQEYGLDLNGAGPGPEYRDKSGYWRNIENCAAVGRSEVVFQVIAHEMAAVGQIDSSIGIGFGVSWGDAVWSGTDNGFTAPQTLARFTPREYNQPVPVALIRLSADRKSPLVLQELR